MWIMGSQPTAYTILCYDFITRSYQGNPLFPEITSPWAIPFLYVFCMKAIYCLYETLLSGDTLKGWWNEQRMWMIRRITSYLYGFIDTIRKLLGLSKMSFKVTTKVSDEMKQRGKQEIIEFGLSSPEYVIITTAALFNFVCLVGALF